VLGSDVSGTVERSRADGFAAGDEVFGLVRTGAYAEFAATPAAMIMSKPAALSHEQAARAAVAGMTAWQALFDRAGLQRGQSVVISGAAGGVGHLAVQLAKKLAGARTIGIGSARNRDFVLGLGADEYVDYTQQDVARRGERGGRRVRRRRRRDDADAAAHGRAGRRPGHDRRIPSGAGGGRARGCAPSC